MKLQKCSKFYIQSKNDQFFFKILIKSEKFGNISNYLFIYILNY